MVYESIWIKSFSDSYFIQIASQKRKNQIKIVSPAGTYLKKGEFKVFSQTVYEWGISQICLKMDFMQSNFPQERSRPCMQSILRESLFFALP
jgi:hypothetical protein